MSRSIHFRAWSAKGCCWLNAEEHYLVMSGRGVVYNYEDLGCGVLGSDIGDKDVVLEQFTGLIDSKRCKIYEGDIVITAPSNGCLTSILTPEEFTVYAHGRVAFICGSWMICQPHLGATPLHDFADCECCPTHSITVVGNIRENADLLAP